MFKQFAERYGSAIEDQMRHVIGNLDDTPDEFDTMLQYPLGWVNADGSHYPEVTGKRIRPMLLLLCAEASGNNWKTALPAAAAVEILHNFSLIHDDIQDASETRHNRDTVWRIWGKSLAINAGDAMFGLSYRALEQLSEQNLDPQIILAAWRIYNQTIVELTRGQYLDISFETRDTVTTDDYLSMIRGKTAALLSTAAQLGALISTGDEAVANEYAAFGLNLGIAFQVRDDILGIWGDPDQTGKSAASDIVSRKKSLPVLYGLGNSPYLADIYAAETITDEDVAQAVALLEDIGAREYAQDLEEEYYSAAVSALTRANPQGPAAEQLFELVAGLFGRTH